MAKARKQKSGGEEQKAAEEGKKPATAVVRHQKLCLSIDMKRRMVFGHTELEVVIPERGLVELYADEMTIRSISVDGEPADYKFFPHHQVADVEKRWHSASCPDLAADAACTEYISYLEKEMAPNLIIPCQKTETRINDEQSQIHATNGSLESHGESKHTSNNCNGHIVHENVKLISIDYWIEKPKTGIHFWGNVLYTDNQIRRAHCWFPCMDSSLQRCCYDLEFTVDSNFVAVSNGILLHQVLSKDDPTRKTFVYKLTSPVSASWISLAVAPFEIFPDRYNGGIISHMSLPSHLSRLQNTVVFFHSAFRHYEDYLSASFPFASYKQVFIPPEMSISSMSLGASMCIFSSQILHDEKVIDQTINARIKLAYALARQWFGIYITAESSNDEWLLDGLAGFLTDSFIKKFLGNNEARFRRYQANCAVCKIDVSGATALSSSAVMKDNYGTQGIGLYGKIRTWKSVAILQMLEKQMGPESFRKILHTIINRAQETTRSLRTLNTKEFRHLANKIGNLERPFLKEFFPRWLESCGCPVLRMGFCYNKRKNMIELAVLRGCTAIADAIPDRNPEAEAREANPGWPGMMSIRVHELDGMYDHPILSMDGETWQLLEIQCHSKLSVKRIQKTKKGAKTDGSDDNCDVAPASDLRSGVDSPLLWVRVDPEMEYLAEIYFHQPVQMWINQLEKDKDVVAQMHAISSLEALPHSFSVVNTLSNFLGDSKAFWRVRIEAAFALARLASEETDLAGLQYLVKFYKSRRYDADIGLPRPNDFHDYQEYFVLEAIPHAVASVRAADGKSPREAVEFVLQLLKYNDNNGNPYSDVYWLAALVQSIGELEFGQQSISFLSSLLKRIDRLLQFDRLMPSCNGILTVSCIRTLTQISLKLSASLSVDRVYELIKPFRNPENMIWAVRIEASRALIDLEFFSKGLDAALVLFVEFLEEEPSLRGQVKLAVHAMHLCQVRRECESGTVIGSHMLVMLLHLLASRMAFNNVLLRHYLFCILQIAAQRPPTLYGVPRSEVHHMENAEVFAGKINSSPIIADQVNPGPAVAEQVTSAPLKLRITKSHDQTPNHSTDSLAIVEAVMDGDAVSNATVSNKLRIPVTGEHTPNISTDNLAVVEAKDADTLSNVSERMKLKVISKTPPLSTDSVAIVEAVKEADTVSNVSERMKLKVISKTQELSTDSVAIVEAVKEADTVSNVSERRVLKIRVKQPSASIRVDDMENIIDHSHGGHNETEVGPSSSVSVDAPLKVLGSPKMSTSNQNIEDVSSFQRQQSLMTASIGSAKVANINEVAKELQCTADSKKGAPPEYQSSPSIHLDVGDADVPKNIDIKPPQAVDDQELTEKSKKRKKDKDKKRKREEKSDHKVHRDDPEYLEKKRLKKERKRAEKEMAKLQSGANRASSSMGKASEQRTEVTPVKSRKMEEAIELKVAKNEEAKVDSIRTTSVPKIRIKIKGQSLQGPNK
ncbi:hypothetical protein QJS10_CPB19g01579 [Acorus calamus]|uniref:Transcription initiation factor TFIID subunit 2 n=1 Tax=Acorus calamus TaxID=4465 RepID=A0AAV9CHL0_ACOCL|nr:hypothetical protein QJS10_CPB19g01579 [Acorus calamus]